MEHSEDGGVGASNPAKKRFPPGKSGSFLAQKKKKKAISSSSQPQIQPQSQSQPSGTRPPRKCFNCDSPDHMIKECPKPLSCS